MKNTTLKNRIFKMISLSILIFSLSSCTKDEDYTLMKTIFISDPDFPELPIYSEWGFNTFGAYIDREPFVSSENIQPAKIIVINDTLKLLFRGRYKNTFTEMIFMLKGYKPKNPFDLIMMNSVQIDLRKDNCKIQFMQDSNVKNLDIIEGELYFKKIQRLWVDEEEVKTIISGYFSFKTFFGKEPVAIYQGRFDLGIGYDNFFNLTPDE